VAAEAKTVDTDELLLMRDVVDEQLRTADGRDVGRVADVEAEWRDDGTLVLTNLHVGPEALAGRVSKHLRPVARFLFRDRFEHRIPMGEISEIELDLQLKQDASRYRVGQADAWVLDHILRFIPGNGRR
jgi:sporulation protein YlmC with PRC-barrel domain